MKDFIEAALIDLEKASSSEYGIVWCQYRIQFFRQFANNKITSTRFGSDFFHSIKFLLSLTKQEARKHLCDSTGQIGELDKNLLEILFS